MTLACDAQKTPFRLPSTCMPDEFYRCWDYGSSELFPACPSAAPSSLETEQPVETDCERRCKHDILRQTEDPREIKRMLTECWADCESSG